jgi:condensin complex subunit 2
MLDQDSGEYMVTMNHSKNPDQMHEDILSYFDQALQKNWTSAEHWRIRKIKDVNKPADAKRTRKEKEPFEIDFFSPLDPVLAEVIYTPASSNSAICMPKKDWKSKTRNLLPDDKHFSSKQLLSLFLKPKARMGRRRVLGRAGTGFGLGNGFGAAAAQQDRDDVPEGDMDEAFWAQRKEPLHNTEDTALPQGDYDANFFQDDLPFAGGLDDDDDDLEFADAREHFSPGADLAPGMTEGVGLTAAFNGETLMGPTAGPFGTTLVTQTRRVRPEYVQYARVAKKVDVRRLKEEIWKGMGFESLENVRVFPPQTPCIFFLPFFSCRCEDKRKANTSLTRPTIPTPPDSPHHHPHPTILSPWTQRPQPTRRSNSPTWSTTSNPCIPSRP